MPTRRTNIQSLGLFAAATWMRDTGPVFVVTENDDKAGVGFNFNGWGEKQDFDQDAKVASFVTQRTGVRRIQTELILEGGGMTQQEPKG